MKLLNGLSASAVKKRAQLINSLIRYEGRLGAGLFGPIPADRHREFFCLDESTWVWHEEWTDVATGQRQSLTTRYILRPGQGIVKTTGDGNYRRLGAAEARNLRRTAEAYQRKVLDAYDKVLPA